MLSTETPPDPSCSSKIPAVRTDVKASSESLASQEEDTVVLEERTTPTFSIRDYVFASRNKGIEASWPFAPQFLQLCLKHGVDDLLPPFEHPDTVRAQSSKATESVQPAACSEPNKITAHFNRLEPTDASFSDGEPARIQQESGLTLEELVLDSPDSAVHPSPRDRKSTFYQGLNVNEFSHSDVGIASIAGTPQQTEEISSQICGLPCLVSLSKSSSKAQLHPEATDPNHNLEKLCEPLEKNRLIVKLDVILETCQTDLVNNSGMILHPMASQVCPVCKKFSFTSNTTLNAHIDQCLSMGSNSKGVLDNIPKYKVKPRKKRLMVDIYATAPCCTLEDLDKRNGTNWASELALVTATTNGIGAHARMPEVSPTDSTYDGNGTVYVDSNGVKLRILSKFNDQTLSRENFKLRKHAKDSKESKDLVTSKKKHFAPKHFKNMKLKAQKAQLIPFNILKSEIQAAAEVDCDTENNQKNDKSPSYVSDSGNRDMRVASATIKQWTCSRRSGILRKLTKKDNCSTLEDMVPITRNMQAMNVQSDSGNSADVKMLPKKFSTSSEDSTGSPKTKRDYAVHRMDERKRESLELPFSSSRWSSEGTSSANGLILKLSRSSGSFTCSSMMKSIETDMGTQEDFDTTSNRKMILSKSWCSKLKDQRNSTLTKNVVVRKPFCLEARKIGAIEKPSISKKFRKHRTHLRTGQNGELPPTNNAGMCNPTDNICLLRTKEKNTLVSRQSCTPKSITMSGGEVMNEVPPSRINITEYSIRMEQQESSNLKNLPSGAQCHDTEIETSSMQVEIFDSGAHVTKSSMEKSVLDPIAYDTVNSEKTEPTFSTQPNSCPCEESAQPISESEANPEQLKQAFNEQDKFSGDGFSSDIGNQEIQMTEVRRRKDSCTSQPTECQADALSVQESSGCLTSHSDVGLEMPEKSSSINSFRITASHVQNLASEGKPSGSPVSTASTISLPSPVDSKSQDSEVELLSRAISVQDNLHSVIPFAESIEALQDRKLENRNQENKGSVTDKEPDRCLDGERFCCSCRESLSRDSELFRQKGTARTSKPKRVSNLCIRPRNSSSFNIYQNHRNNAVANSNNGTPNQFVSKNSTLDFAVKFPIYDNISSPRPSPQSQDHSVSSPILRLMGKNLMVVNHEGIVQTQTTALDCTQQVDLSSNGYASSNNHLKQEIFPYQHNQLLSGSPAFGPALLRGDHLMPINLPSIPVGGYAWAPLQNGCSGKPDQKTQQRKSHRKLNSSHHIPDEAIVIDDTSEHDTGLKGCLTSSASPLPLTTGLSPLHHRPFSCYPLQHQIGDCPRPLFPNVYSSVNVGFMNQGITFERQGPFLPSHTFFQSATGQRGPLIYYSRTLH